MIYILREGNTDNYKIGYTSKRVPRLKGNQTGNPRRLITIATFDGDELKEAEIHRKLMQYRCEGGTEWFTLPDAVVAELIQGRYENNTDFSAIGGASPFDVRPLRGRQCDLVAGGRAPLHRRRTAFDSARNQSFFTVGRREYQVGVPPVFRETGQDDSAGDIVLLPD